MNKRLLSLLALPCLALLTACPEPPPGNTEGRPYIDEWRTELEGPADMLTFLSIGNRQTMDNYANRGDVEVIYDPAATMVKIEMQRFTIVSSQELADAAFERMEFWGYDSASVGKFDPENVPADAEKLCFAPDKTGCYVRAYYDGQAQPVRDGANFRVTIPAGWTGDLQITTSDNINDGLETYPDRSDVTVTGLAGSLTLDLDSGNVAVKLDPTIDHYAGCASNDICEIGNPDAMPTPLLPFDPSCGCTDPTFVAIENAPGQASNIVVDVPTTSAVTNEPRWYDVRLENEGTFSSNGDFVCQATIDCDAFGAGCLINPDFTNIEYKEWAEINYPGDPAIPATGIQINVTSTDCSNVPYLEDPLDYDLEEFPEEQRGNLRVCSGCL
jgi:hypothetical protein